MDDATKPDVKETPIGDIENYYGGLSVMRDKGKCYWSIKNWDGHNWIEIPETLFNALRNYERRRPKQ